MNEILNLNRPRVAQQLNAGNSRSGNPRRVWVISELYETGLPGRDRDLFGYAHIVAVIDEGYDGRPSELLSRWKCFELVGESIPAKRYRELLTWAEREDKLFNHNGSPR